MLRPLLAVVPARGGSRGLPGKNVRPLAGLPLLMHSVRCAEMCGEVDRVIVSTDAPAIAEVARAHGAEVPFLRPAELATDEAPMLPVLQHALRTAEEERGERYGALLLLDPTTPGRTPADVTRAVEMLEADPRADGVVAVSEMEHNPIWYCVVEEEGYLRDLVPGGGRFARRQDVPPAYRINGALYLWRRDFLADTDDWRIGRLKLLPVPEERAVNIDTLAQFQRAEAMIARGSLCLPWLAA